MGLLRKTIEYINASSKKDKIHQLSSSPYQKNIINEISQQINLCKINRLPLAIVQISCHSLIKNIISNNKTLNPVTIKENINSFIEQLLTDETKLMSLGNNRYLFTLYNPNSVDPKLVVHQLSRALSYYNNDISDDMIIDFHTKIRIYPDHGEDAEILLNSLI